MNQCELEREKLAKLLIKYGITWYPYKLADYLLENGVVVLPCKVGDDVYCLAGSDGNKIEKDECIGYYIKPEQRNLITEVRVVSAKGNYGTYGVIGESFFLTREEAEQALKGGLNDE